ncbi:LysR family transcriptional regulator [Nonomuraea bangladeshensis]|uniref:LysR family transcriptional regulator n=1 Tax=Nonomuraea bangladeshensis TaxID=404385 RepID=A0ABV3H657_9ACTN
METRELRYFVAVAEELHFGRAAERLGIAQPPLSRTVMRLERRLGVKLLERSSRRVALTPAGSVLLAEGRTILAALSAAERRAREAAADEPRLILATKAGASGELLAKLLDAYAAEPGAVTVDLLLCESQQQQRLLRDGEADAALLHLPFDSVAGFDTETLCTEGQVAVLPAGHPLTARPRLMSAEVAALPGLPQARWPGPDGSYPEGPGPEVRSLTQLLQMVALGRASVILPESVRANLRPDLATVPVVDAPPVTTVIAWPPHSRSRALAHLVRVATGR